MIGAWNLCFLVLEFILLCPSFCYDNWSLFSSCGDIFFVATVHGATGGSSAAAYIEAKRHVPRKQSLHAGSPSSGRDDKV